MFKITFYSKNVKYLLIAILSIYIINYFLIKPTNYLTYKITVYNE